MAPKRWCWLTPSRLRLKFRSSRASRPTLTPTCRLFTGIRIGSRRTAVSRRNFSISSAGSSTKAPPFRRTTWTAADVCVIGRSVRDQLFGVEDPIGKVIRVKDLPCKVVGTLMPKGLSVSGQDQDDTIILPYTTAQKKIKGITWLDDILCSAVSQDAVKIAGQEAAALLRDRHHLRPEEDDDFNIRNPEDIIQAQLEASKTLTVLLIAIASISLIVGGIGIMNVMLVSVTERTREIGVRVAVGATEEAIQLQFLGESVMLSLVGGGAGVLFGILGSYMVGQTLRWPMQMSLESVIVAALFSVAVGVFFGYYPARKASLLDPIEALRYE